MGGRFVLSEADLLSVESAFQYLERCPIKERGSIGRFFVQFVAGNRGGKARVGLQWLSQKKKKGLVWLGSAQLGK